MGIRAQESMRNWKLMNAEGLAKGRRSYSAVRRLMPWVYSTGLGLWKLYIKGLGQWVLFLEY